MRLLSKKIIILVTTAILSCFFAVANAKSDLTNKNAVQSTYMISSSAKKDYDIGKAKRESEIKLLTAKWSSQQQMALTNLRKVADTFFKTRVENEVDTSGTLRGVYQIGEQSDLETNFKHLLESLEMGKLPSYSAKEFEKSDAELNATYAAAIKDSEKGNWGSVTKAGIVQTEKAWIRYRDAWVKFGSIRYPQVSADSWKTWITNERINQLKNNTPSKVGDQ